MATTVVNGATGWFFWLIAARALSPGDLGRATATTNLLGIVALFTTLGVGSSIISVLPTRGPGRQRARIVLAAVTATGVAALLAAPIVVFALPHVSSGMAQAVTGSVAIFVVIGILASTWSIITDRTFIASRRTSAMLARNAGFGSLKLVLLGAAVLAGSHSATTVVATWVIASCVLLVAFVTVIAPRVVPDVIASPGPGWTKEIPALLRPSALHQVAVIGGEIPSLLMPLIVLTRAGAGSAGRAYVAWTIGSIFFTISSAASAAMFAEGAHEPGEVLAHRRTAIRLTVALLIPVGLGALLLGRPVLSLFGKGYASNGWPILAVLVLSALPDAITNIGIAEWRVRGRLGRVAVLNATIALTCTGLVWYFVGRYGAIGLGYGWLGAQSVGSVVLIGWNRWRPATSKGMPK